MGTGILHYSKDVISPSCVLAFCTYCALGLKTFSTTLSKILLLYASLFLNQEYVIYNLLITQTLRFRNKFNLLFRWFEILIFVIDSRRSGMNENALVPSLNFGAAAADQRVLHNDR